MERKQRQIGEPRHFTRIALQQTLDVVGDSHWRVERVDEEDGKIHYEVWGDAEGFILSVYEDLTPNAKSVAYLIAEGKNEMRSFLSQPATSAGGE